MPGRDGTGPMGNGPLGCGCGRGYGRGLYCKKTSGFWDLFSFRRWFGRRFTK